MNKPKPHKGRNTARPADARARDGRKAKPGGKPKRPASGKAKPPRDQRAAQRRPHAGDQKATSGLLSRHLALTILEAVIRDRTSLDRALPTALDDRRFVGLDARDKAFARLLAMTVLRHHASLEKVVAEFLSKPLAANAERIRLILLIGAAELILLDIAPYAAISTAVELTRLSVKTRHFDRLANAVLRRVSETGKPLYETRYAATDNFPDWMIRAWQAAYGNAVADRIATASLREAALDISVKDDPAAWASRLDADVLTTGSLRRAAGGQIDELAGYGEGAWWVQDAAAALPARLIGAGPGMRVLDLCAAPGGKTAQLCATGADVTAVDIALPRLERLRANLDRLGFAADITSGDAATWRHVEPFDAVLIDAPCSATGTIRRHPDILHLKRPDDIDRLVDVQQRLLANAATLVVAGGTLVYCTCSLEPAEGCERIDAFLAAHATGAVQFERVPLSAGEIGGHDDWITPAGDLRTLPFHDPAENPALAGLDGFYAARLRRRA